MEETYLLNYPGVKKKILAGGNGPMPHFPPGTKLVFHFQTLLDNFERTVIDDSRKAKAKVPMEIFVGKMFKMEVWETLLTSMRIGEVAEFWCDAVHTGLYPIVSKGMRLIAQGKDPLEGQRHTCGMGNMFHYNTTGWPELDELMRTPQALIFIMELIQVGDPFSYKRESWIMDKDEKMKEVPSLHLQGNALVRQGHFREAAKKYQEAVVLLRIVLSKEMPGDEDYIAVDRLITPLVLNYCQCMLELEEYYEVLEHTSDLIHKHKDCVKAYYKRAKAHAAVWNEKEAKRDFNMVANLDITLAPLVHKELRFLADRLKEKYWEEKEKYWNCLEQEEKEGKKEEDEEKEDEEGKKETDGESTVTKVKDKEKSKDNSASSKEEVKDVKDDKQNETGWKKAIEKDGTTITATVKDKAKVKDRTANQATMKDETANKRTESTPETQPETNQSALSVIEGMDWQQKLRHIMFLEKEGNFLLTEQKHSEATTKFKEALEYVDFIQNKELCYKDRREDWDSLEKVRVPITLNLSQCLLELRDYQEVVALNTKLLKKHRDNFKAVYQRARAHSALCNEEEARNDFQKVEHLEPRFKPIVNQEMKRLGENLRNKHIIDKKNYWEATEEKWGLEGTKTKARKVKKTVKFQEEKKVEGSVQKEGEAGKTVKEGGSDGVREEKKPEGKGEEGSAESAEKAAIAEKEGGSGGVENDSGKRRVSIEVERGGQAGLVNRAGDKETDMAQTNEGRDNVATERSGKDKAVKKGKCHLTATQEVTKGSTGNKGTNESTRSKAIQSESTNRSPLATADLPNPQATEVLSEVAEERVGLDTQINRPNKGEAGESKLNEGSKSEGKSSDEQLCSSEGASHTKSGVSTGNPSFKSKRKHKKKK
ncbi:FK506-binding protein 5 [Oncorhynchus tshawytscha]|uniref:AIP/AIPL N-terminal FKBP-type PPIase domain-containing protein n=1 Tax=Oncorhynchus tshawytscha TaxID=74940 RepID=A0A8C8D104_ONCTS|nr:FK506-binding protein 5 [Oncorhynchus tshawytscha]